ncbi:dihydrodipicolinate synthase family protein [Streptomyces sp. NPDC048550]|uniref:dihydrodipicolinate synthase family protein n=1 Tax=unclassified Streptomyces TaxID=2593676 RepID=UPI00224DC6F1|nr:MULTISPECIES: dihydrodipicolinate synthase family protein [unclassified Streptomyces]MCX5151151.1 dihydrodipicolinate synthase family protein [Streptomyces sp. NBC_00320]WSN47303.1 dihydrodipicolinate synthase family protein [Streptomyces sp. NBC_01296]WSW63450.1 dihydrodipicolinate synthase family protein [Streptomyces sp. NBC_00998]
MAQNLSLHGIHVPLVTPFTRSGDVAADALEALAHTVLDEGATGIVALGTTGEPAALDEAERDLVTDVCARVCRERGAMLTVGAGANGTRAAEAALGRLARWPEVRAALVTVPSFVRPAAAGVLAHFARLAEVSPVPLVVYHIPYRTGQPLDAAALRALGELPGVAGMKYAGGGIGEDAVALLGAPPDGFAVLAGDDVYLSPLLALGASGGILASAHLATARYAELTAAWQAGDVPRARALGHGLARLSAALFAEPNPAVVKAVLHARGRIPTPDVRLPLLPAGEEAVSVALARLAEL